MNFQAFLAQNHRILLYVAIGVGLLIVIAVIRALSRRTENSFSLSSPPSTDVTPITDASSTRCTHCNAGLSPRSDFCPECGYAQPMQQTGTAPLRG